MSLQTIEEPSAANYGGDILEMEASGKLVSSDFEGLESTFQRKLKQGHKLRVLLKMQDFHGWEPAAFWDEVKFDLKHFGDIERLAMVGDERWEKFLTEFSRPFTAAKIRYFDASALAAARSWLQERT